VEDTVADIEVDVRTAAGHRVVGTGTAERTAAGHMLSDMVVAAEGTVQALAYSQAVLFVLVLLAYRADCRNWHRSASQERFSAHS